MGKVRRKRGAGRRNWSLRGPEGRSGARQKRDESLRCECVLRAQHRVRIPSWGFSANIHYQISRRISQEIRKKYHNSPVKIKVQRSTFLVCRDPHQGGKSKSRKSCHTQGEVKVAVSGSQNRSS